MVELLPNSYKSLASIPGTTSEQTKNPQKMPLYTHKIAIRDYQKIKSVDKHVENWNSYIARVSVTGKK